MTVNSVEQVNVITQSEIFGQLKTDRNEILACCLGALEIEMCVQEIGDVCL